MSDPLYAKLKPIALLGGYDAAELWWTNNFSLATWAMLIFLPRWKYTPSLSLIAPVLNSVVYAGAIISLIMNADPDEEGADMMTIEGVVKLFQDPNGVFVGWVHYIAFDALVGRMVTLDSVSRDASFIAHVVYVVPCVCLTCLLGPCGFLLYMLTREFILPVKKGALEMEKAKVF